MKVVRKEVLPKCDFCDNIADYDAPTKSGSWANMCEECKPAEASGIADLVGYKLEQHTPAVPVETNNIIPIGTERNDFETIIMDGDREIGCPDCDLDHSVEPDADYELSCEGCGIRFKVPEGPC